VRGQPPQPHRRASRVARRVHGVEVSRIVASGDPYTLIQHPLDHMRMADPESQHEPLWEPLEEQPLREARALRRPRMDARNARRDRGSNEWPPAAVKSEC
jgi:hypothetical protein